jgi:ABC-type nitrate/sulfonate/bicarbonate transport system substrate-binding protein
LKVFRDIFRPFVLSLFAVAGLQPSFALAQAPYVLNAAGFDADAYGSWPVLIAQEKGLFARDGIQLRSIRTDKAMMGLLAGSFEVINGGTFAALLAAEKGANLVLPYVLCSRPAEYLVVRKPLTMLRELEGETIGVFQIPSTVHLLVKRHLQRSGLDLKKITFRSTGGSRERLASLVAGQTAATLLSATYAFRAQETGLKIIGTPADWERIPWTTIAFRKPWAEANASLVVKYLRAIRQATLWLYDPANFEEARRTLTSLSGLNEGTVRWSLKSALDSKIYNLNKPELKDFQSLEAWLLAESVLTQPSNLASLLDTQYYDQAVKR